MAGGKQVARLVNHVTIVAKMIIARRENLCIGEVIRWLRADRELEHMAALCKGSHMTDFEKKWSDVTAALSTV